MAISVELPSLGESVLEGTVARWLVAEGDRVEVDQPLVEVTTDKVDAEIPSPVAGRIEKRLVAEGDVVAVGAQLCLVEEGASGATSAGSATVPESSSAAASAPPEPSHVAGEGEGRATPVARRLAEEAHVDLGAIEGTGSGGRVTKADVLRHTEVTPPSPAAAPAAAATAAPVAQAAPATAPAPPAPAARRPAPSPPAYSLEEGDRVIPMTPMRRIIAEHMVYSKRTSPHVGTVAEVDMTAVVNLRKKQKDRFQETHGVSLTFLPFIVAATVRALREYPALNASVIEDAIVEKAGVHIGIAVETGKGLVVPVIRHADRLSLSGLAMTIHDLSERARNKKLGADELRGGTFTVSNPGRQGNLYGFAIINQPQVGILRLGEMKKRPVVKELDGEDAIVIRSMMYLALSYDHRAVDGAPANGFLHRIRELLEAADFDL